MKKFLNFSSNISFQLGLFFGTFFSVKLIYFFNILHRSFISGFYKREFKYFGNSSRIGTKCTIIKPKYISFGSNSSVGNNTTLSCYETENLKIKPNLTIGNGVSIGSDSHITCSNNIIIGNGVLTGKKVLITDNAHGFSTSTSINTPPINRRIFSKGPVIIDDNVWIGEKVSILPNVKIGKGAIIAAGAVVTKNVPQNCLVGGVPAKILNQF